MIEMIIVLVITFMMTSLTIYHIPDVSAFKFHYLRELLYQKQFESINKQKRNEIEIFDSTLYINDVEHDLSPLSCDHEIFHYNEQGNISKALTLVCNYKYEYRLQLGSGWISYE